MSKRCKIDDVIDNVILGLLTKTDTFVFWQNMSNTNIKTEEVFPTNTIHFKHSFPFLYLGHESPQSSMDFDITTL